MFITLPTHTTEGLDELDTAYVNRAGSFRASGSAYAQMHGTRPSTIGHVLASNPLALLAW